jgi:hypothetical protein
VDIALKFGFSRWLIASLVLANIAIYYWYQLRPEPPERTYSQRGERLVLLSELELADPDTVAAPLGGDSDEDPGAKQFADEPGGSFADGETQEPVALGPFGTRFVQLETDELVPITVSVSRLQLPPKPQTCWRLGPVPEGEERARLATDLLASDVVIRTQVESFARETRYWVYLDAGDDREQMTALRQQLRERKLDNYLIASGALEGQLSLGLFRTPERAEIIQRERLAQGFDAQLYLSESSEEQTWYLLDEADLAKLEWEAVEGPTTNLPDLALVQTGCAGEL